MFDLNGKTALITGASGGIGQAIAACLHAQGADVVLHGTREAVLNEIAARLGARAHVVTGDLGDAAALESIISRAESATGAVDILINNAGLTRDTLAMRMKDDDWDKVISVNLGAAFKLARGCLKGMMKRRWGRIISVTSIVGVTGNPGQANYAAAKAGLIGMSKSLAQEVASRGITVNCVAPGFIATPMTDALNESQQKAILDRIPAGAMGTPDDIAAAILYLASNESGYVTGQTLHVNGGMAMI